jgi:hypothetical protein
MRTLNLLLISLCLVVHVSFAQDAGDAPLVDSIMEKTRAELSKMKIPELRAMLTARGIRFDGAEKRDFIDRVFEVQGDPTVAATPTATPTAVVEEEAAAPPPPPPDFNYEDIMAKMGSGKKRVERLKKKMLARGMDVSGIDSSVLGGLADGGMDDEQLIKILASLGNARKAEGGAAAPNADAATDAGGSADAAAAEDGEAASASPTPKATKNARKKPTPTGAAAKSGSPSKTTSAAKGGKSPKPTQPMSTPKGGAATSKKSASPTPAKKKVQTDEATTTSDKESPSTPTPTPTRRKPSRTPAPKPRSWQKPVPVAVEHVRDEAEEVDLDSIEEEFGGEDLDL